MEEGERNLNKEDKTIKKLILQWILTLKVFDFLRISFVE